MSGIELVDLLINGVLVNPFMGIIGITIFMTSIIILVMSLFFASTKRK